MMVLNFNPSLHIPTPTRTHPDLYSLAYIPWIWDKIDYSNIL